MTMFERGHFLKASWPVSMEEYDAYQKVEYSTRRRIRNLPRIQKVLAESAIIVGCALLPFGIHEKYDVAPERERLSHTQPEIIDAHPAMHEDDRTRAVIDMVGLGNLSAKETATTLSSLSEIGAVMAVRYDNQGIDATVIAQRLEEKLKLDAMNSVVLMGHSMGGDVALQVATYLYEQTAVEVEAVVLDCTPLTLDTVRQEEREKGELMQSWLRYIPGGEVSRSIRFVAEMGARADRYLTFNESGIAVDDGVFIDSAKEVYREKIANKDAASNGLIESQFSVISSSTALSNVERLHAPIEGKTPPIFIYMRPASGTDDTVVDVDDSQRRMYETVRRENGKLVVIRMNDTGHANPNQRPDQYNEAIGQKVVPYINSYRAAEHEIQFASFTPEQIAILGVDEHGP